MYNIQPSEPLPEKSINTYDKWKFTLITTFILVLIMNPYTYTLVDKLLGSIVGKIASAAGCPTNLGFILHVIVFTIVIRYTMDLKL